MPKKIIHIDMDAFYASVEQRDFPEWKGKPVVVGGSPHSRGVVCAASYEARKYGIRSAISCYQAFKLCPDAIFTPPRFEVYKSIAKQIRSIFFDYTDLVEPLSLDEAYLDVTENKKGIPHATSIAKEIRKRVWEDTALTCSAGVSSNKFLAKMASEKNKPNGMFVILPGEEEDFLNAINLNQFHGIGKKTYDRFLQMGIKTGLDLKKIPESQLVQEFGKSGSYFYQIARGIDEREVVPYRDPKSVGVESTFARDSESFSYLMLKLEELAAELAARSAKKNKQGKTLSLKVKFEDFTVKQRNITQNFPFSKAEDIFPQASMLFQKIWKDNTDPKKKIRLLGLSLSSFVEEILLKDQPSLFG